MNPQMLQYIQCMWHLGLWRFLQGRRNSFRCFQHIQITKYINAIAGCHDFPGSRSDYAELLVDAHNLSVEFQLSLADLVELAELGPTPRPPKAPRGPQCLLTHSDIFWHVGKGERGRCLVANHSHWRPRNTSLRGLVSVTIGFGQAWQQSAPVGAVRCTAMMVVLAESRRNSWLSAISTSMYCRMTF